MKDKTKRLGSKNDVDDVINHPFFSDINTNELLAKWIEAPYKPEINMDDITSNFDSSVTEMNPRESIISED